MIRSSTSRNRTRLLATGTACALALGLAACGDSDSGSGSDGPVTLEVWTGAQGADKAVKQFNAAHDDITLKYVKVPGDKMSNQLNNSHKAGDKDKSPCLIQSDNREGSMLMAQGVLKDISGELKGSEGKFSDGAIKALSIGGKTYGVPDGRQPIFTIFNRKVFDTAGLDYPKTWEEMIDAGKELRKGGVKIFNLAGEDPSTWMNMAWQAGARWYTVKGDSWKINFTDGHSEWAAGIMQQMLDEKLVSKISYADYAAMIQEYDAGKIASRQVSTWQLSSFEQQIRKTSGQWEPAPNFRAPGEARPSSAADTFGLMVPELCPHSEEAVKAAAWLATNDKPVDTMGSPKTAGWYPAVKDPGPHLDQVVPKKLMGDHADQAVPVIKKSANFAGGWQYGPNSKAMYEELADQWGKAMAGDITVAEILPHMQKWVVNDLKRRKVNVIG
ncbi:ABC transporter substrate-binding protein [Streptomyces boncukensis]|uniref:Extracellular solute-binding protein n=1 Tax=Streptomyces boncukensis TaxID=2711219 RepID=A0A6G4X015_9ACTN|nr:extracellular solute-binding protein [Streptomyces boncukensis]NGO70593.1 extracellular solute-binding protein [Streptomyces boncukensis]